MGPIGCPETSIRNYNYSLHNSPEERSSRNNACSDLSVIMSQVGTYRLSRNVGKELPLLAA